MRLSFSVCAVALLTLAACLEEGGDETNYPEFGPGFEGRSEAACIASGGTWRSGGLSGLQTCFRETRDGGRSCAAAGDCEGLCLARSRTCAPVTPLFGCNDVLGVDGARSTLCVD